MSRSRPLLGLAGVRDVGAGSTSRLEFRRVGVGKPPIGLLFTRWDITDITDITAAPQQAISRRRPRRLWTGPAPTAQSRVPPIR